MKEEHKNNTKAQNLRKIPKLRFPEFEGEWETKKLGEIAENIMYGMNASSIPFDGTNKYLRITDIDDSSRSFKTNQLTSPNGDIEDKYQLNEGDIVFARTGASVGKSYLYNPNDGNLFFAGFLIKFSIINANPYFVFSQTLTTNYNKWIQIMSMRSGQPGINAEEYKNLDLNFTSIQEQNKIVSFLSLIDERINQSMKIIYHYETLMRNLREMIFKQQIKFKDDSGNSFPEWGVRKLREVAEIYDGTHQTPKYVENGISFYSVENVTANNFTVTKYIEENVFEKENKRVKIEKGDILMTRIGDIGTARYIDWEVKASFYVSLALIKQSDKYNSKYLVYYISTDKFQSELWNRTIHVAFPKKINLGEIGECLIDLPTLIEQTHIANFFSSIDQKIETEKKILEQYKNQKAYLLQNMFI